VREIPKTRKKKHPKSKFPFEVLPKMAPQRRKFILALVFGTGFTSAQQQDVFAVTSQSKCGENLPFGTCNNPLTKDSTPYFCMNFEDTLHDAFTQEFYVSDALQFTIEWEFQSGSKSLKDRFINAQQNGEEVKWSVEAAPGLSFNTVSSESHWGVWHFSDGASLADTFTAGSGTKFSADDASWGAAFNDGVSTVDANNKGSIATGWGHENYNGGDSQCSTWYANGVAHQNGQIKNVMKIGRPQNEQGTCFHGASTQVTLEDKTTKAMTELQVGDKIQTADIYGNFDFAPIISLPHKAGNSEMATFLKIVTDAGKSVQMTPGHLIPNCAGKMFSAKDVAVGDCVRTVDGKEAVSEITSATHFGVYTAVTAHALIVANGIIASPFSVDNDPRREQYNAGTSSFLVNFLNTFFAKVNTGLRGANVE